jgi:opacity protein-like surface antigen
MTNLSVLANAYVDLGTYAGFTPYVGAGAGTTYVSWDGDLNTDANGTFYHEGRNSWRFTWALMAGASIDLTCNLKADVGYRYRHINGGSMFGPVSVSNGTDPVSTTGPGYDKGFSIHEIRGGLRYTFGDGGCGQVAYIPPAPMPVYK